MNLGFNSHMSWFSKAFHGIPQESAQEKVEERVEHKDHLPEDCSHRMTSRFFEKINRKLAQRKAEETKPDEQESKEDLLLSQRKKEENPFAACLETNKAFFHGNVGAETPARKKTQKELIGEGSIKTSANSPQMMFGNKVGENEESAKRMDSIGKVEEGRGEVAKEKGEKMGNLRENVDILRRTVKIGKDVLLEEKEYGMDEREVERTNERDGASSPTKGDNAKDSGMDEREASGNGTSGRMRKETEMSSKLEPIPKDRTAEEHCLFTGLRPKSCLTREAAWKEYLEICVDITGDKKCKRILKSIRRSKDIGSLYLEHVTHEDERILFEPQIEISLRSFYYWLHVDDIPLNQAACNVWDKLDEMEKSYWMDEQEKIIGNQFFPQMERKEASDQEAKNSNAQDEQKMIAFFGKKVTSLLLGKKCSRAHTSGSKSSHAPQRDETVGCHSKTPQPQEAPQIPPDAFETPDAFEMRNREKVTSKTTPCSEPPMGEAERALKVRLGLLMPCSRADWCPRVKVATDPQSLRRLISEVNSELEHRRNAGKNIGGEEKEQKEERERDIEIKNNNLESISISPKPSCGVHERRERVADPGPRASPTEECGQKSSKVELSHTPTNHISLASTSDEDTKEELPAWVDIDKVEEDVISMEPVNHEEMSIFGPDTHGNVCTDERADNIFNVSTCESSSYGKEEDASKIEKKSQCVGVMREKTCFFVHEKQEVRNLSHDDMDMDSGETKGREQSEDATQKEPHTGAGSLGGYETCDLPPTGEGLEGPSSGEKEKRQKYDEIRRRLQNALGDPERNPTIARFTSTDHGVKEAEKTEAQFGGEMPTEKMHRSKVKGIDKEKFIIRNTEMGPACKELRNFLGTIDRRSKKRGGLTESQFERLRREVKLDLANDTDDDSVSSRSRVKKFVGMSAEERKGLFITPERGELHSDRVDEGATMQNEYAETDHRELLSSDEISLPRDDTFNDILGSPEIRKKSNETEAHGCQKTRIRGGNTYVSSPKVCDNESASPMEAARDNIDTPCSRRHDAMQEKSNPAPSSESPSFKHPGDINGDVSEQDEDGASVLAEDDFFSPFPPSVSERVDFGTDHKHDDKKIDGVSTANEAFEESGHGLWADELDKNKKIEIKKKSDGSGLREESVYGEESLSHDAELSQKVLYPAPKAKHGQRVGKRQQHMRKEGGEAKIDEEAPLLVWGKIKQISCPERENEKDTEVNETAKKDPASLTMEPQKAPKRRRTRKSKTSCAPSNKSVTITCGMSAVERKKLLFSDPEPRDNYETHTDHAETVVGDQGPTEGKNGSGEGKESHECFVVPSAHECMKGHLCREQLIRDGAQNGGQLKDESGERGDGRHAITGTPRVDRNRPLFMHGESTSYDNMCATPGERDAILRLIHVRDAVCEEQKEQKPLAEEPLRAERSELETKELELKDDAYGKVDDGDNPGNEGSSTTRSPQINLANDAKENKRDRKEEEISINSNSMGSRLMQRLSRRLGMNNKKDEKQSKGNGEEMKPEDIKKSKTGQREKKQKLLACDEERKKEEGDMDPETATCKNDLEPRWNDDNGGSQKTIQGKVDVDNDSNVCSREKQPKKAAKTRPTAARKPKTSSSTNHGLSISVGSSATARRRTLFLDPEPGELHSDYASDNEKIPCAAESPTQEQNNQILDESNGNFSPKNREEARSDLNPKLEPHTLAQEKELAEQAKPKPGKLHTDNCGTPCADRMLYDHGRKSREEESDQRNSASLSPNIHGEIVVNHQLDSAREELAGELHCPSRRSPLPYPRNMDKSQGIACGRERIGVPPFRVKEKIIYETDPEKITVHEHLLEQQPSVTKETGKNENTVRNENIQSGCLAEDKELTASERFTFKDQKEAIGKYKRRHDDGDGDGCVEPAHGVARGISGEKTSIKKEDVITNPSSARSEGKKITRSGMRAEGCENRVEDEGLVNLGVRLKPKAKQRCKRKKSEPEKFKKEEGRSSESLADNEQKPGPKNGKKGHLEKITAFRASYKDKGPGPPKKQSAPKRRPRKPKKCAPINSVVKSLGTSAEERRNKLFLDPEPGELHSDYESRNEKISCAGTESPTQEQNNRILEESNGYSSHTSPRKKHEETRRDVKPKLEPHTEAQEKELVGKAVFDVQENSAIGIKNDPKESRPSMESASSPTRNNDGMIMRVKERTQPLASERLISEQYPSVSQESPASGYTRRTADTKIMNEDQEMTPHEPMLRSRLRKRGERRVRHEDYERSPGEDGDDDMDMILQPEPRASDRYEGGESKRRRLYKDRGENGSGMGGKTCDSGMSEKGFEREKELEFAGSRGKRVLSIERTSTSRDLFRALGDRGNDVMGNEDAHRVARGRIQELCPNPRCDEEVEDINTRNGNRRELSKRSSPARHGMNRVLRDEDSVREPAAAGKHGHTADVRPSDTMRGGRKSKLRKRGEASGVRQRSNKDSLDVARDHTHYWHMLGSMHPGDHRVDLPEEDGRELPEDILPPWMIWQKYQKAPFSDNFVDAEHVRLTFINLLSFEDREPFIQMSKLMYESFSCFMTEYMDLGGSWNSVAVYRWNQSGGWGRRLKRAQETVEKDGVKYQFLRYLEDARAIKEPPLSIHVMPIEKLKERISHVKKSSRKSKGYGKCDDDSGVEYEQLMASRRKNKRPKYLQKPEWMPHCSICLMEKNSRENELVICGGCKKGCHQRCSEPPIVVGSPDETWFCTLCTTQLQQASEYSIGDVVWGRGLTAAEKDTCGPDWPALITRQDFASKQDTMYNWITFFPNHTEGNWCDIKYMKSWDEGKRNLNNVLEMMNKETQKEMLAALKAAESELQKRKTEFTE